MTKQEEMRKVIDLYTDDCCLYPDSNCEFRGSDIVGRYCVSSDGSYKCLMKRLGELGVVIKVDRELPQNRAFTVGYRFQYDNAQEDMLKAGYVATEPLVEE